jgi:hypothetical protein
MKKIFAIRSAKRASSRSSEIFLYNYIDRPGVDLDSSDSMKLKQLSVAFAD